jgi:hypothetical protein
MWQRHRDRRAGNEARAMRLRHFPHRAAAILGGLRMSLKPPSILS